MFSFEIQMARKLDGVHQVVTVGRYMPMQGDGQVTLKIQNPNMTKQNTSSG
jgi:hypothetical protein